VIAGQKQQGDILIQPDSRTRRGARVRPSERGRNVLAAGSSTGHEHYVPADSSELYEVEPFDPTRMVLVVTKPTQLLHDADPIEHDAHDLEPATYLVMRQEQVVNEIRSTVED